MTYTFQNPSEEVIESYLKSAKTIVYGQLKDIPFSVDIVDVFRRSDFLPDVASDFLEADAKVFWSQIGIENEEAEIMLRQAGHQDIVMNRCTKIEYMRLFV